MHEDILKLIDIASESDTISQRQREIIRDKAIALGEDPEMAEVLLDMAVRKSSHERQTINTESVNLGNINHESSPEASQSGIRKNASTHVQSAVSTLGKAKSRIVAGILAIFLGGLGIHKFYLENVKSGIIYLLLSWTMVPMVIGWIEGLVYLLESDSKFESRIKG